MDDNQIANPLNNTALPPEPENSVAPPVAPPAPAPMPQPAYMDVTATPVETMNAIPETPILRSEEPTAAPLPPVEVAHSNSAGFLTKKVMIIFAGIALLGSLVGGSWYAYSQYAGEQARIALIGDNDKQACEAKGCNAAGYKWVWRSAEQECKVSNIKCDTAPNGDYVPPAPDEKDAPSTCGSSTADGCCGDGYVYCGGQINKCVSHAAIAENGGGCNTYGENVYGIPTVYGAMATKGTCSAASVASGIATQCNCGTGDVCFDRRGECFLGTNNDYSVDGNGVPTNPNNVVRSNGTIVNMGLCGIVASYNTASNSVQENATYYDYAACFDCTVNSAGVTTGCSLKTGAPASCYGNNGCTLVHYTCDDTKTGTSCTENEKLLGEDNFNGSFFGTCGKVEQLDVMCGGQYVTSRTQINPPCASPSSGTSASLSCTSLTKNVPTPTIGSVVTLTCAGSVSPTGATALTYKFRYNVNGGAWTNLTNATPTTAQMTPNQCGTYSAQCQACGTINGAQVCDPVWTAASAQ